jgi:uncharacterized membrane protein HdeD (DUF308 family)
LAGEEVDVGPPSGGTGRDEGLSRRPRWEPVVRGLVVLAIGVVALVTPDITAEQLLTLFGTMVLVEGIFHLVGSFKVKASNPQWALMSYGGVFSMCMGLLVLGWVEDMDIDLLVFIAVWGVVLGTVHAVFAAKAGIGRMAILFVAGVVSIAFGLYALLLEDGVAVDMVTEIAAVTLVIGVLLLVVGGSAEGSAG